MKKVFTLAIITAIIFSSCSPTNIVSSWKDPETKIQNPKAHKIVVAALIYDQSVRRQIEDYMTSLYPGKATQSYLIMRGDSLLNGKEEMYTQRMKDQGYDGIVIMRQTSETTTQNWIPGRAPSFYTTWGGYWRSGWTSTYFSPGTPGHIQTDRTWHVEVNVFSLLTNKLIWAASTNTTDPGGRVPLFTDVCKAVRKQMKSDGFLN